MRTQWMVGGLCASLFSDTLWDCELFLRNPKRQRPLELQLLKHKPLHALKARLKVKVGSLRPTLMLLHSGGKTYGHGYQSLMKGHSHTMEQNAHPHSMRGEERVIGVCNLLLFFSISHGSSCPFLPHKQEHLAEMGISASPNQCNQGWAILFSERVGGNVL